MSSAAAVLTGCPLCLAELYEIFLSRAKEKWRSYSETSSVSDSESGRTRPPAARPPPPPALTLAPLFVAEAASVADRESSLDLIKLDISRTFPSLFIFQKVPHLRDPPPPLPPR